MRDLVTFNFCWIVTVEYDEIRQRREDLRSALGEVGSPERQTVELGKPRQEGKVRIRRRCGTEMQLTKILQHAEVLKSGACDLGRTDMEHTQVRQSVQPRQPRVRDACSTDLERQWFGERFESRKIEVSQGFAVGQVDEQSIELIWQFGSDLNWPADGPGVAFENINFARD